MRIKKLDPKVYRKIAAGEVVERPASVVKEFIENSLDAKATKIVVEVEKGGIERIKVVDNGSGIEEEDLPLVFEHHSTSKISVDEDLLNIKTMGFRGEALSSISSVSKATIISRTKNAPKGYFYSVSGGDFAEHGTKAFQEGTSIEVKELFFNVPARKKFLKTPYTEFLHITKIFIDLSLANINVSFKLIHNGKDIYNLSAVSDFSDRIKQLFGENVLENNIPIFCEHPHIKISGFIGKPQMSYDSKSKQFLMVNNRPVRDRIINSAVREGFGNLIMHSVSPLYFINITAPFDFVDVNIHPRKEEVKFINSNLIYSLVKNAVSEALSKKDLSFRPNVPNFYRTEEQKTSFNKPGFINTQENVSDFSFRKTPSSAETLDFYSKLNSDDVIKILQFSNCYILAVINNNLEIYDQHALHERVLYEKFKKAIKDRSHFSQVLLTPQILELPEDDFQILSKNIKLFEKVGFDIEISGVRSLKITAIPSFLNTNFSALMNMLKEFVEDLKDKNVFKEISSMEERAISIMSCRSAVKAGDVLTYGEALNLIKEGYKLEGVYTCPHGRPFKIKISAKDLEKMFKRTL